MTEITAQGAEDIPGKALRVNAHERRRGMNVAHDQGNGGFWQAAPVRRAFKTEDAKLAPACRKVGAGYLLDGAHTEIIAGLDFRGVTGDPAEREPCTCGRRSETCAPRAARHKDQ